MGSKSQTSQTQQFSTPANPAALQQIYNTVQGAASTPFTPYSGELTAGWNPQQQTATNNINAAAGQAQPLINQAAGLTSGAATPLTAAQIQQYQNPYTQSVIDATQAQFNQQNAVQQNQVKGSAAAAGALGGDRQAVAQAETAKAQQLAQAPVIAGLQSQGYQQALQTAQQQFQQNPLAAAAQLGNLGVAGQTAALQGAGAQLGVGGQQQQTQQAADTAAYQQYLQQQGYPFQTAAFLAQYGLPAALGQGTNTFGTQTTPGPNIFGQIAGLGIAGAGLFSDERVKENIQHVGETHDGQPIYTYRYKGSPFTQMGLMAQDVEQSHPEAVGNVGGIKTVNYDLATARSKNFADGGSVYPFGMSILDAPGYVPVGKGGGAPGPTSLQTPQLQFAKPQADEFGLGQISQGLGGLKGSLGGASYGGGNIFTGSYGGSSSSPLEGLTAADYGEGFKRGGFVDAVNEIHRSIRKARGGTVTVDLPFAGYANGGRHFALGGDVDDDTISSAPLPPIAGVDMSADVSLPPREIAGADQPTTDVAMSDNAASWANFAQRPRDQGGLGLAPHQAYGIVGNLVNESTPNITPWGVSGDAGTAQGAAQWRGDRLARLKAMFPDSYQTTEAQQAFMRSELEGPESKAYLALRASKTPEEAANAVNHLYERSADTTGHRAAAARSLYEEAGGQGDDVLAGGSGSDRLTTPAPSAPGMGGWNPFNLSDKTRQALIAAGLGIAASKSPFALTQLGEGGLKGLAEYGELGKEEREAADKAQSRKMEQQRIDLEGRRLAQTIDQQRLTNAQAPLIRDASGNLVPNKAYLDVKRQEAEINQRDKFIPAGSVTTGDGQVHPAVLNQADGQILDAVTKKPPQAGDKVQGKDATGKNNPEIAENIAAGIKSGDQPPTLTGLYGQSAAVRASLQRQGFNLSKAQVEWDTAKRQIASLNGPQMTRFVGLANSVDNTIDEVRELSKQLGNIGIPALNRIKLAALVNTRGNSPEGQLAARYLTSLNTLKEEFANLAQGGYAPTEATWHLANQQINGDFGVDQLGASLDEVQRLVRYRVNAVPGLAQMGPGTANRYTGATGAAAAPPPPGAAPAGGGAASPAKTVTQNGFTYTLQPDGTYK
ncbi:phage tail tip lysozyme [Bradyrhizobium cenepequi]|uniref:phage tail tip lysozyme n=1 Tax=Bradyrhizobium cenepequi TaxID=2821403 RepID=UPI001CE30F0E|nr:phage tail tip lysozyme [Bradyrhizobium cenepequi]MCA6108090.1 tail fiber domain-containing protein [Bradyrhizobium cenepequi]